MTSPEGVNGGPLSSGSATRAAFRQDSDRLILTNPHFAVAFSASNGAIISLFNRRTQIELIDEAGALSEGVLWRCRMAVADGETTTLTSRDWSAFSHRIEGDAEGKLHLWLVWKGLRLGAEALEAEVAAVVTFRADSSTASFTLGMRLPDHLSVQSVDFPCLCFLGSAGLAADEALFLPLGSGVLIHEPRAALAAQGDEAVWRAVYPGPASMQFMGFSIGDRATVWLASADSSGARKSLSAGGSPRSDRLSLWMIHAAIRDADGSWTLGCAASLGLVTGDWFEAARDYRAWAVNQPWCGRGRGGERGLPALTGSYGLWLSHWGSSRGAVAATRELQRAVNVPIKLDWRCWHRCLWGGAYPDYFPPRDGDQAFMDAKRQLAGSGVLCQLSLNGLLASPASEAWKAEDAASAALGSTDHPPTGLISMCPSAAYWRGKLVWLARGAARYSAEGVYLQDLGIAEPTECGDASHGHAAPGTVAWTDGVRRMLAEVGSALDKSLNLTTDGPNEAYLHLVDAFLSPHAAAEREGSFPDLPGHRWSAIPLFSSVYHGYTTLVGPGSSLVNHRPHDPLAGAASADLRLPTHLMARDFPGQFYLEIARATVWGHQIMISNFSPEQASNDSNRKKLAFLSTVMRAQAWGVGALLAYSEFMGLLHIKCHNIDVDLLVNPPGSEPSERRVMRRTVPSILGSAWRTPGGGLALILVSIHDQPVEFTTRLRSSRLEVNLPVQFIGRTFSEDGDVPAATLRASGSEVSGKLPGRSVILLTLR